jgi:hydrogenase maturation protease
MNSARILVAGIGNIFFGDDAFGVEVVERLARRNLPDGVHVADFGIRGLDLAYALLDPYELAILVDAVPRGGVPGTLYVIEPTAEELRGDAGQGFSLDTHSMDPVKVLRMAASLGTPVKRVIVLGCEPSPFDSENDMAMGLSPPVEAALDEAVRLAESLIAENLVQV